MSHRWRAIGTLHGFTLLLATPAAYAAPNLCVSNGYVTVSHGTAT